MSLRLTETILQSHSVINLELTTVHYGGFLTSFLLQSCSCENDDGWQRRLLIKMNSIGNEYCLRYGFQHTKTDESGPRNDIGGCPSCISADRGRDESIRGLYCTRCTQSDEMASEF